MTIASAPPAVIFVNAEISPNVQAALVRQLFINETINGAEFDARVAQDPSYPIIVHGNNLRVMVTRPLNDFTNRTLADIVLFVKAGLASVEINKYGPPGITLSVDRVYYTALVNLQKVNAALATEREDLDDGFVGQDDNDDFDPLHLDPSPNVEPVKN